MKPEVRQVVPAMRAVFTIGSVLVTIAGIQLYFMTDRTDRFFAWTIDSGLSATFLGAFYFMALAVAMRSRRMPVWAEARVGVYGVMLFVTLMLTTTLVHLDKFHLTEGDTAAKVAAWAWLFVYVFATVGIAIALVLQHRAPGGDPARTALLPTWYRAILVVQAVTIFVVGILLFVAPASASWWPWELTPLAARAMASWMLGLAVVIGTAILENDWRRINVATPAYALVAILLSIAMLRYSDELQGGASTICYALAVAVAAFTGIVGTAMGSRAGDVAPSTAVP
jgi:hypothetical protein